MCIYNVLKHIIVYRNLIKLTWSKCLPVVIEQCLLYKTAQVPPNFEVQLWPQHKRWPPECRASLDKCTSLFSKLCWALEKAVCVACGLLTQLWPIQESLPLDLGKSHATKPRSWRSQVPASCCTSGTLICVTTQPLSDSRGEQRLKYYLMFQWQMHPHLKVHSTMHRRLYCTHWNLNLLHC